MSQNYRDIKNDLIKCPFNSNHLVKRCRLITHKKICPDKNRKEFMLCPYNPIHLILTKNLEEHKSSCPDRVNISKDLEEEMEAFIKKNKKNKIKGKKIKLKEKNVTKKYRDLNCNKSYKELFNNLFNDNVAVEYDSDFSENDYNFD